MMKNRIGFGKSRLVPLHCTALAALALATPAMADDHVVIGPGGAIVPVYEGASGYRVLPIPFVDVKHGHWFLNATDGAGFDAIDTGSFVFGASVNYVPGYRTKDAPYGVGGLGDAAGARVFAIYQANRIRFEVGGTRSLGGTNGMTADAALSYTAQMGKKFSLTPSVATAWADGRYDRHYFGITGPQSLASGLAPYQPGAGFKDVSTGLTAKYVLNRHWVVAVEGAERGILGDAADSPIVRHKWQPLGSLGIAYAF